MYFEEIPCYVFEEVRRCVASTILCVCDSAEYLGDEEYGPKDIYELYGTRYEDIIPDFLSCQKGESDGGMWGNLYRFGLTEPLKQHILEEGLTGMLKAGEAVLENLRLYRGEKCLFSCVSHEVFSTWRKRTTV